MVKKIISTIVLTNLVIMLSQCSTHAVITTEPLEKGSVVKGISWSIENITPVLFYKYGLSEKSDIGIRIGLPIYGTGVDFSYTVFNTEKRREIINFAYSINSNSNFDFTYYSIRKIKASLIKSLYSGFRLMYIPYGITGGRSFRFGFLAGVVIKKAGFECGYFHDFEKGQPAEKIFNIKPSIPYAITDFGFPTEYSRIVGISLIIYYIF
ncbi:MAG: hypothetical protein H0Z29_05150 [Candidatus Marinimicrobia bacterium]|nr:hypothetical protein [Candidatus Neomarinimicrobiota bacterium]